MNRRSLIRRLAPVAAIAAAAVLGGCVAYPAPYGYYGAPYGYAYAAPPAVGFWWGGGWHDHWGHRWH